MAALADNVLKMVRRLEHGVGPPGSASPGLNTAGSTENEVDPV